MKLSRRLLLASTAATFATRAFAETWGVAPKQSFREVIEKVVAMPGDSDLQQRCARLGLEVMNVMWEDTGRYEGSSVGPNISDLTLQVREKVGENVRTSLLPVIRHPNFGDKTADVKAEQLWVRIGNERAGATRRAVRLTEVLEHLGEYLSASSTLKGSGNLLAKRDTHFLVSAQHVFVPLPREGKAEFNPVLFNYQSYPGNPAVLTLLVTREGLSVRVIENKPGDQTFQGWGQQLYFNDKGQKTTFTAERKSAVANRIASGQGTKADEGALRPRRWKRQARPTSRCGASVRTSSRRCSATAMRWARMKSVEASRSNVTTGSPCASRCSSTRRPATAWCPTPTSPT